MTITRGDIVLVEFPFASGTTAKLRPAVVVQSNVNNRRLQTVIFVPITSNTRYSGESTQVLIDSSTPEGKQSGLLKASSIKCENIATVEAKLIHRKIGTLHVKLMQQLNTALLAALGIE